MLRNLLNLAVFLAGLAAVCCIAVGYIGSNPLGAVVATLIGAGYLAGGLELLRFRQATSTLQHALAGLSSAPDNLDAWLQRLHPSLRNAVRLRVEGERVALPAPALTPYLVGLLVLLGMLGTLLGMMATLRGTGLALESASDLQAIRGSLAAPVKGLGFAFGTSIAGVASSAMLGLLSALCRRERLQAAQQLDGSIATTLRTHSRAHQREEMFRLVQQQALAMPTLVDRLQAMIAAVEQQNQAANERQLASQDAFHTRTEAVYTRLASSVEASLKDNVAEGARAASAALQPVVEATMAGLARESGQLRDSVNLAVQQQLEGLAAGFERNSASVAKIWSEALAENQRGHASLIHAMQQQLDSVATGFESSTASVAKIWNDALAESRRSHEGLTLAVKQQLEDVTAGFEGTTTAVARIWNDALAASQRTHEGLTLAVKQQLEGVTAGFESGTASVAKLWNEALAETRRTHEALTGDLRGSLAQFSDTFGERSAALLQDVSVRLDASGAATTQAWNDALSRQQAINAELSSRNQQALDEVTARFNERAASLVGVVQQSHADLQATLEARDEARLKAWADSFGAMSAAAGKQWTEVALQAASSQQAICDTLSKTAAEISAQAQAHAGETIAEISRLVQAASEAPKVAAEVVAELRQKLSDSMVRDTAMLEERSRLLATLETLLDAVNHASTEQRAAVDALVGTSADLLDRVSTRFTDHIEAETGKLTTVAAQLTGSAVEVASLGEAFGGAVDLFGKSNEAMVERLQDIAAALDRSQVRSDEQLAYYVAQAREVIDLSMLSQKQIIEELQLAARQQAAAGAETA